jgi:hypothetical protein
MNKLVEDSNRFFLPANHLAGSVEIDRMGNNASIGSDVEMLKRTMLRLRV